MRTSDSHRRRALTLLACLLLAAVPAIADEKGIADFPQLSAESDWPWWRGPQRNGIATTAPVPTSFGDNENVVWKVPVPGRGHSSPTVVGNRVFLTTADNRKEIHYVLGI